MGDNVIKMIADYFAITFKNFFIGDTIKDAMGAGTGTMSTIMDKLQDACINTIIPGFQAVGTAIAAAFFLISLLELAQSERFTLEYFIKFFSKFIIAVALVALSGTIVSTCINFGNTLADEMSPLLVAALNSSENSTSDAIAESIKSTLVGDDNHPGIFTGVSWLLLLVQYGLIIIVMFIVSLITKVVVYIIGVSRILELNIRGCFMPIALGLMADDGWRGSGGRYIKKFLAICSQSTVLTAIAGISDLIMISAANSMFTNWSPGADGSIFGGFVIIIGVAFATISIMFKSIGIINDVFGA